jgi:branched-chain amino acid aminotransferase
MNGVLAKMESIRLGAFEGVMLTADGYLAEGTVSNVFVVKNSIIQTPALEGTLLAGITRNYILKLAKQFGYKTKESRLRLSDLTGADEVFLSNTTMEVMPVRRLILHLHSQKKTKNVQKRAPGPVTRHLMDSFEIARIRAL